MSDNKNHGFEDYNAKKKNLDDNLNYAKTYAKNFTQAFLDDKLRLREQKLEDSKGLFESTKKFFNPLREEESKTEWSSWFPFINLQKKSRGQQIVNLFINIEKMLNDKKDDFVELMESIETNTGGCKRGYQDDQKI